MGGRHAKRPTQWVAGNAYNVTESVFNLAVAGTVTSTELVGASGTAVAFDPPLIQRFTVERIRGQVAITLDGVPATGVVVDLSLGIIVKTEPASGPVAATTPDPRSSGDAGEPWLWLYTTKFRNVPRANANLIDQWNTPYVLDLDVKSRRKIREGQVVYFVASAVVTSAGNAANLRVRPSLRTLISRVA